MFLPVSDKPQFLSLDYSRAIVEIPNVITNDIANELKAYASNTELSGMHKRGSKNPAICHASFYTCLVFEHNSNIYEILDPIWEQFCVLKKPNVSFIEPYEIKSYLKGDCFGTHNDVLISKDETLKRKVNLIVQLSDENDYEGGDLIVGSETCSRKFGTGIFFPAMCDHSITPITNGNRFSLIGHAWGPL